MEKVIITGASGFIGKPTIKEFCNNGIDVIAVGRGDRPADLDERAQYIKCDVRNHEQLYEATRMFRLSVWIHLAWEGSSGDDRSNYGLQLSNAMCVANCMKVAAKVGCKRFIGAGSIMERELLEVVGKDGTYPEKSYIYGAGKYVAHSICKSMASNLGIEFIWCVITNVYGIGEVSPRFINTTLRKISGNKELKFTSAFQNYDFIYIDDAAYALYCIAEKGKSQSSYVIGSGRARPLREFILEIGSVLNVTSRLSFGDVAFTGVNLPLDAFDITSLEQDCGFKPKILFKEGIRMTFDWIHGGVISKIINWLLGFAPIQCYGLEVCYD